MRNYVLLALVLVFGLFTLSLENRTNAAKAAKPGSDTPATTTVADIDPVAGTIYSLGSDSLGSYFNGVDSVSSIVQGIGDWVLDTKSSTTRKVRVDFGDPVIGSGANAPFAAAVVPVRFISQCGSNPLQALGQGLSQSCGLVVSIDYAGSKYSLRSAVPTAPGTDAALWTCLARNTTKCVSWQMTPSGSYIGQSKNVMQLFKVASKPSQSDQPLGQFYMSFKVNVATP